MQLPDNKTLNRAQLQYQPFDFGTEDERLERCFDEALSTLKTMYHGNTLFHSDMYGIDVFDSNANRIAQYSTGLVNNRIAIQNIFTKEVLQL
ncbi:MAG: hypothetical protein IKP73_06130 [Bacteroidales bacterium]|nr:hypothetical protein [Bacteroidales bacterium]